MRNNTDVPALVRSRASRHALIDPIAALGDIVTIWAHPDDEAYLVAGVMAIATTIGAHVTCVTATAGEANGPLEDRAALAAERVAELGDALDHLGVTDSVVLGLPDGGCAAIDPEPAIQSLHDILRDRRPDTVITFGPDGLTGHSDHRAVSRWTSAAVARLEGPSPRVLHAAVTSELVDEFAHIDEQFSVYEPGLPTTCDRRSLALELELDGEWLDLKVAALRAHGTQTAALIDAIGLGQYRRWVSTESFVESPRPR